MQQILEYRIQGTPGLSDVVQKELATEVIQLLIHLIIRRFFPGIEPIIIVGCDLVQYRSSPVCQMTCVIPFLLLQVFELVDHAGTPQIRIVTENPVCLENIGIDYDIGNLQRSREKQIVQPANAGYPHVALPMGKTAFPTVQCNGFQSHSLRLVNGQSITGKRI